MGLPDGCAGLSPDLAAWASLAVGFALMAAGLPLSSLALFGLLAGLASESHVPWWWAGVLAGVATARGHVASYVLFAHLGPSFLETVARWIPGLALLVSRLQPLLARRKPWSSLLLLRWIGLGYTQLFWILAATGMVRPALLALLLLDDLAWALAWAYGTIALLIAVPEAGRWLSTGALALLVLSLAAGSWRLVRRRGGAEPG
ncbi:MAG: hypothetical protein IRZ26_03530 [Clostridia bacterium]|nr:hypothetical protein [Clostridia bacterium]